tara:strand:+ start:473 stop:1330 length:858 start_codon:yes stop_codon:yes gene_type:complete
MPKKKTNADLIKNYLEHIIKEKKVSQGTITTYKNIGESLPFNLLSSQTTIITKLKDLYSNPNTLQLYLNMIILVRRYNDEETDKLIKLRNSLKDDIVKTRKEKLDKLDDELPSYDFIMKELDDATGSRYILNYLILNHGLRNKDLNLKYVKSLPSENNRDENYILIKPKDVLLNINDYKTEKSHGSKEFKIKDTKFRNELKSLNLKNDDYLFSKRDGSKITNISTFNDKIINHTINRLGQNKLFKIVIKKLLNNKSFDTLEQLSKDRGTSMDVLLKSYNLENGEK